MIQRKQTIFLLLAFVLTMVCLSSRLGTYVGSDGLAMGYLYNLFISDALGVRHFTVWPLMAVQLVASVLMLVAVFLYKRRPVQSLVATTSSLLQVVWYVLLAALAGEGLTMGIVAALPAVSAILCFMARQAIRADERLVRSMDRIR